MIEDSASKQGQESTSVAASEDGEATEVDGGSVILTVKPEPAISEPKKFDENRVNTFIRFYLAWVLLLAVLMLISLHYVVLFKQNPLDTERLKLIDDFFGKWFPALTAILGSAITFYFRDSSKK